MGQANSIKRSLNVTQIARVKEETLYISLVSRHRGL